MHTAWTPKFGVELKFPRQAIAYVSATRGFKSGGFNLSSTQPGRGFAPEWAWSHEGGVKTTLMNGRARLNAVVFDRDYTNLQVQTPIGIGVYDIRNAAAATIRGFEVEGAGRIGRGFDAGGHLTWLDATYDRYVAVAIGGVVGDVAGNRLNNAPEWAGRLWAGWNGSLASSDLLSLTIDATAQSTVFYTPFNDDVQRQRPYALVGARVQYGPLIDAVRSTSMCGTWPGQITSWRHSRPRQPMRQRSASAPELSVPLRWQTAAPRDPA